MDIHITAGPLLAPPADFDRWRQDNPMPEGDRYEDEDDDFEYDEEDDYVSRHEAAITDLDPRY